MTRVRRRNIAALDCDRRRRRRRARARLPPRTPDRRDRRRPSTSSRSAAARSAPPASVRTARRSLQRGVGREAARASSRGREAPESRAFGARRSGSARRLAEPARWPSRSGAITRFPSLRPERSRGRRSPAAAPARSPGGRLCSPTGVPTGRTLAIVRDVDGEEPPRVSDRARCSTRPRAGSHPRVSPNGDSGRVPGPPEFHGRRRRHRRGRRPGGKKTTISTVYCACGVSRGHPDGSEVWFTAATGRRKPGALRDEPSGKTRVRSPGHRVADSPRRLARTAGCSSRTRTPSRASSRCSPARTTSATSPGSTGA